MTTTRPATQTKGHTMTRNAEIENAREVDTRIAAAWDVYWTAQDKVDATEKSIRTYRYLNGDYSARIAKREIDLESRRGERNEKREAVKALDAAEYKGWRRFFLVKHIHSSQHCSSFRPTTRVGWLPQVSGLTEAEAVAEYDATLCTKCFSSAPVAK